MKHQNSISFLRFFFLFLVGAALFGACNKDNGDDGVSLGDGCNVSFKVNGESFNYEDMGLCVYFDENFTMSAFVSGGPFLLQVDPINGPGTFVFDANNQDQAVLISIELNDGRLIGMLNGQIKVEEISSGKARGSFSGTFFDLADINLSPDFEVTDGQFNANF